MSKEPRAEGSLSGARIVQTPRPSAWRLYRLPLLSAVLLALTFYPWCYERLIWLAFAPLLVWLGDPSVTHRQATKGLVVVGSLYLFSLLAPLFSIGWWGWGATTGQGLRAYFSHQRVFMAVLLGGISVFCGGFWMAVGGRLVRPYLARPFAGLWIVPSSSVLAEYLGHRIVFGFQWGVIGNRLHDHEVLRQVASVTGVYGLSFLVLMVNTLVASWIIHINFAKQNLSTREQPGQFPARPSLIAATLVVGALVITSLAYGRSALRRVEHDGAPLRVALLQGAKPSYAPDDFTPDGLDPLYPSLMEQALIQRPDLLVLPETVWWRTLQADGTSNAWGKRPISPAQLQEELASRLRGTPTLVVLGIDSVMGGKIYNTTTFWTADGLAWLYRKRRLVPFSEYRPAVLGRFAPQNRFHGAQFAYARGSGSQLVRLGRLVIGTFICQEVLVPELARSSVRDGAQLLVTTGNDGVFSSPIVALEQANIAKLRAVENGRYLLRCMKSGVSAIMDPCGRVLAHGPINQQMLVTGTVYPVAKLTWYTRFGDWIVWLSAVVLLGSLLVRLAAAVRRGRRAVSNSA